MLTTQGFQVQIVADTKVPSLGTRLITMQLRYPRFIHAEFMTHRMFSRNASSSRAIPVAKMIDQVCNEPAMPIHWGQNQPGMQASQEVQHVGHARDLWKRAAARAAEDAQQMMEMGLHKQIVNRILEPFQFIHVVVSATEWANFFDLRRHADAQPEIHLLADMMSQAREESVPVNVNPGYWHLPYVTDVERGLFRNEALVKMSAARCARVSYLTHDGVSPDPTKDIELYDRLVGSEPIHASPTEHQAQAAKDRLLYKNFRGWIQHRYEVEGNFEPTSSR